MTASPSTHSSSPNYADWRRWAVYEALWHAPGPLTTQSLCDHLRARGWSRVLPTSSHYDAVRRTLLSLKSRGYAQHDGRPARWRLTVNGRDFASEFIIDNPNITPDRMDEEAA